MFAEWFEFKALDLIWGNGEFAFKLCRAVIVILSIIALHHVLNYSDPKLVSSYFDALAMSPQYFWGHYYSLSIQHRF